MHSILNKTPFVGDYNNTLKSYHINRIYTVRDETRRNQRM